MCLLCSAMWAKLHGVECECVCVCVWDDLYSFHKKLNCESCLLHVRQITYYITQHSKVRSASDPVHFLSISANIASWPADLPFCVHAEKDSSSHSLICVSGNFDLFSHGFSAPFQVLPWYVMMSATIAGMWAPLCWLWKTVSSFPQLLWQQFANPQSS